MIHSESYLKKFKRGKDTNVAEEMLKQVNCTEVQMYAMITARQRGLSNTTTSATTTTTKDTRKYNFLYQMHAE